MKGKRRFALLSDCHDAVKPIAELNHVLQWCRSCNSSVCGCGEHYFVAGWRNTIDKTCRHALKYGMISKSARPDDDLCSPLRNAALPVYRELGAGR